MKIAEKYVRGTYNIKDSVDFSIEGIKYILRKIGPRAPGSKQELEAQTLMAKSLGQWADEVKTEDFTVHPAAFMGFIPFTVALVMIATVLFGSHPVVALVLALIASVPLILEFVMYKQFVDKLFPARTSHNVIATRRSSGETKKRIILCGHSDSQYEWTLNYKLGGNGMKALLIPAVVGLVVFIIVAALKLIIINGMGIDSGFFFGLFKVLRYALFIFFPFYIGFLFFQHPTKSVPGASDNLSGCYTVMSVLKCLAEADVRFENTEVVVLLSGSEEAGLRGAKAFAKAHIDGLKDKNIETCFVAVDTVRDLEYMAIYDRDLSGTLRHDKDVKAMMKRAGENCGYDLKYSSVYIGASDAAALTQAGIKSTCLAAMDPTPPRYYHTRLDDESTLVPEAFEAFLNILLEAVCLFDSEK